MNLTYTSVTSWIIRSSTTSTSTDSLDGDFCTSCRNIKRLFRSSVTKILVAPLSPRVPHSHEHHRGHKYHRVEGEEQVLTRTRAQDERPRARIYTREGVLVCRLHGLVLSFRRISVHIVTFFTFFRFGSRREAELCGVAPHCGGVLWGGVSPHCGTTLRFACMVLLALRACSLSEAGSALRAPHCAALVWCYLRCARFASPRPVPH